MDGIFVIVASILLAAWATFSLGENPFKLLQKNSEGKLIKGNVISLIFYIIIMLLCLFFVWQGILLI